jgi:hypothetical protein
MHGGVPEANEHITTIAADLFTTEDLRNAVRSFVTEERARPRSPDG